MLMPLMGVRPSPRIPTHRNAMVSQVTASIARTLKPMGCWVPWPAMNACLLGKVVLPRGSEYKSVHALLLFSVRTYSRQAN